MTVRPASAVDRVRSRVRAARGSSSEVASSRMSVCGSSSTSRASATSWAWAGLSSRWPEPTIVSIPSGSPSTQASAPMASIASRIVSSEAPGRPRRTLSATVPTNTWCSWVTRATWRRSSSSVRSVSDTPPTVTLPEVGGLMPASIRPSVDLPDPEGPTTASRSPGTSSRSIPWSTSTPSR